MQRARNFGPRDEAPLPEASDLAFVGVDMRAPPLVQPGFVSSAKNLRLVDGVYETRRGLFAPAWTRHASTDFPYRASYLRDDDAAYIAAYRTTYGGGVFSDPASGGQTWIVRVCAAALVFTRETEIGRIVPFAPGLSVSAACQVVQNFNELVIVRGDDETSLVWSGSWVDQVEELVPDSIPSGYAAMPNAHYGLAWRERLVLLADRDDVAFGRIALNTLYGTDDLIYVNRGRGDRLRSAAPLGGASLLILKSQSAHVFTAGLADLSDARLDEVPVAMQFDSPHTTVTADGRVWWLDRRGIRTARIAAINADNKVIVEVQVMSDLIAPLIRRINWAVASLFAAAVTEERIYFAVALDTETTPKTLLVWNRQNGGAWESYDQSATAFSVLAFATAIPWLNSPRLFAIDAAGRQVCLDYMLGEDSIAWSGTLATRSAIEAELITRGYTAGTNDPKRWIRAQVQLDTWHSIVYFSTLFDGPGETLSLGQFTRDGTKYFTALPDFVPNNTNNDFHTARRQDYSVALGAIPDSGNANWTAGTTYNYYGPDYLNDQVYEPTNAHNYEAKVTALAVAPNRPDLDPLTWLNLGDAEPTLYTTWTLAATYVAGESVIYGTTYYTALTSNTASMGNGPLYDTATWLDLGLDSAAITGALYLQSGIRIEDYQTAVERREINRDAAWCQVAISHTRGSLKVRSVSLEAHAGTRSNLTHA